MLKKHKNILLETVRNSGLDPIWFRAYEARPEHDKGFVTRVWSRLTMLNQTPIFTVQVIDSPIKFCVRHRSFYELFDYKHTYFDPRFSEKDWSNEPKSIDEIVKVFNTWLRSEAREYIEDKQLPDLWEEIEAYREFITNATIPTQGSSSFTEEEKEVLRRSVQEFRQKVIESFNPSSDQEKFINGQLEYLSKAVDRLNRFDWRGLAISTLIGIAINLSVDTEKGRHLFRLFQQAFQAAGKLLQ